MDLTEVYITHTNQLHVLISVKVVMQLFRQIFITKLNFIKEQAKSTRKQIETDIWIDVSGMSV